MTFDIPSLRLRNHGLSAPIVGSPKAIVAWMGALQAQDFPMAKWAVGIRLRNATKAGVDAALDKGGIIRVHALRPTWHLLAAEDVRWIMELTAPNILKTLVGRHKELELTETVLAKSGRVLERTLRNGRHSTREELIRELNNAGIATDENRASHIFLAAELEMLICSGKSKGGKPTSALMDERVPAAKPIRREEALALLAERYYASHGPAQTSDFAWWSGLSLKDAKRALDMAKPKLVSEMVGPKTYWCREARAVQDKETVHFLPAYDEFIIGYADRSDVLPAGKPRRAVSANGLFRPTIMIGGRVTGLWKRVARNDGIALEMDLFTKPGREILNSLKRQSARLGKFWGTKVELKPV